MIDRAALIARAQAIRTELQALPTVEPPPEPVLARIAPDPLVIYDGPRGADADECYVAWIRWGTTGGDWIDADGVYRGPRPFASRALVKSQAGFITLDATGLVVQGRETQLVVRGSANPLAWIHSRETGNGPKLEVTYADDGSTELLPSIGDVGVDPSTSYETGGRTRITLAPGSPALFRFPATTRAHSAATLVLAIETVHANGTADLFRFTVQRSPVDLPDFTIKGDPRVFYETTAFEDCYEDLQAFVARPSSQWQTPLPSAPMSGLGEHLFGHSAFGNADVYQQRAIVNTPTGKVLRLTLDPRINSCVSASLQFPGGLEATEAIVEFDVRFSPEVVQYSTWGSKLFAGFSSSTKNDDANYAARHGLQVGRAGTLLKGNGGAKPLGADGWSARTHTTIPFPPAHPLGGRTPVGVYCYHPDQPYANGDVWQFSGEGSVPVDERVRFTMRLKVNDVGQDNAEIDAWTNGRPSLRKRNLRLRLTDNPIIAAEPYNVPSKLLIGRVWFATYHGGAPRISQRGWIDVSNFRVLKVA